MMHVSSILKFTLYVASGICGGVYYSGNNKQKPIVHANLEKEAKSAAENMLEIYSSADHLLLTSTPYVIALLGQLMLLATENDFSMAENPPKEGFQYLNYPKSFRASLVQMTNVGWEAFNKAHVNMDSIRLHAKNIEHYVLTLVKILETGTAEEIQALVPITMSKIERIANECVTLSSSVENKFDLFMEVISELLEASTSAKNVYDEKSQETERVIQAAKREKQHTLLEREILRKQFDGVQRDMHNARNMFEKTVTDMPSAWKLLGLKLLDTFSFDSIKNVFWGNSSPAVQQFLVREESVSEEDIARQHAYEFANDIQEHVQTLVNIATSGKEKGHKEPNWNDIESVYSLKHNILFVKGNLERDDLITDVHEEGIEMCDEAIRLSEQLVIFSKELSPKKESIESLIMDAEDLLIESGKYVSKSTAYVISKGAPAWWSSSTFSSGFVDSEIKKAEMNVEVSKDILKEARKKQEDVIRSIRKNDERMEATLKELANTKFTNVDFNEIRKTISKGLEALSNVRKEWGRVVRYFQFLSKLVKINLIEFIDDLSEYSHLGSNQISKKDKMLELTHDLIYKQVFDVIIVTHAVHELSSIYVEISAKYLIEEINGLGRLAALDPKTDRQEIEKKRNKLFETSLNARGQITRQIILKRGKFKQEMDEKFKQMQ